MKIIMPLLKFGAAGGAIYLVAEQGLFSHSQKETIEASKKMKSLVSGLDTYEIVPKGMPQFSTRDLNIAGYWNTGVKVSASALASLPSDAAGLISCGILHLRKELQKQLNSSSSSQEKKVTKEVEGKEP